VNELTAPKDVADLPALIESAVRHLQEAKGIDEVRYIHDIMEAARVFAAKHKAAVAAHNECSFVVVISEQRIAVEIEKGREKGEIAKQGHNRWSKNLDLEESQVYPATLAEIGVTQDQARDYKALKDAPIQELREVVEDANARGAQVKKVDFKRKAQEGQAKKRRATAPKSSDLPKPRVDYFGRPEWLNDFSLWVQSGERSINKWGDPAELAATAARCGIRLDHQALRNLAQFLIASAEATEAVRAAA
jgi:hypothetical protein